MRTRVPKEVSEWASNGRHPMLRVLKTIYENGERYESLRAVINCKTCKSVISGIQLASDWDETITACYPHRNHRFSVELYDLEIV